VFLPHPASRRRDNNKSTIPCSDDASFKALPFTLRPLYAAIESIARAADTVCRRRRSRGLPQPAKARAGDGPTKGGKEEGWLAGRCWIGARSENTVGRGVS